MVGVVVGEEGGEVGVVVYFEDRDGLCRGWGRI